jgi:hypothetical protein
MPAGWLKKDEAPQCGWSPTTGEGARAVKRDRLYLVDGGYYENSGLETALEIATRLRALVRGCTKPVGSGGLMSTPTYCDHFKIPYGLDIRTILIFAKDLRGRHVC